MRKSLGYRDALLLLGAGNSVAVRIADRLAAAAADAADAATAGALTFLELRDDIVGWGRGVASGLRERLSGVSRLDRTERLVAAHNVIVITSFFEALDDSGLDLTAAHLTRGEQVALATESVPRRNYRDLVAHLTGAGLPLPTPYRPFEVVDEKLYEYYYGLSTRLDRFLSGLAAFAPGPVIGEEPQDALIRRAVERYGMTFRRLAAEVPEFAVWAGMIDEQATRAALGLLGGELRERLDTLTTGLAGVRALLAAVGSGRAADASRVELARLYRSYLDKRILDSRSAPQDVVLPRLGAAYVNPAARIAANPRPNEVATEHWWDEAPMVPDIQAFLVAHLTGPHATRAPLIVLGRPGSGKSVLTQILAASLPEADFLPIRVELRAVAADADVYEQIRQAVDMTIGRRVDWPDLAAAVPGALPVLMLDGFDELLQATGVNQADYLERARAFQEREADLGRPVAVIVTSRTTVADRARFPEGSVAVRLEPFDETRVRRWLDLWAGENANVLASRGLHPLTPEAALAQAELVGEPLLLLMLALYDATSNALQREGAALNRAELYERLMTDFARREIRKTRSALPEDEEHRAIELELRQLGIAALAMFNRGQQYVSEPDLDADLANLCAAGSTAPSASGLNRPLTAAQTVVGRFFFIHEPTARRDTGTVERSFEFLHATFGEFLVARLVVHTLLDLVEDRHFQSTRLTPTPLDAGFLYAATSFELLSSRAPIIEFCSGLFDLYDGPAYRSLAITLLQDALYPHPQWSHAGYEPVRLPAPRRYAAFSANLLLLAVYAEGTPIAGKDLLGDWLSAWPSLGSLWWSQLPDCNTLIAFLRVRWAVGHPMAIEPEDGSPVLITQNDLLTAEYRDLVVAAESDAGFRSRSADLFTTPDDLDGLFPYWRYVSENDGSGGVPGGAARCLLLELALAPRDAIPPARRTEIYHRLVGDVSWEECEAALRLLRHDVRDLDPHDVNDILRPLNPRMLESGAYFDVVAEFALWFGGERRAFVAEVCAAILTENPEAEPALRAAFERVKVSFPEAD